MSTHAARTEAPAARRKTPIERMDDHAQECAWRLAEAQERNRRDWLSQGDGAGRANAARETLWFSPACVPPKQSSLFDAIIEGAVA